MIPEIWCTTDREMDGRMGGWMDRRMEGQADRRTDGQTNGRTEKVSDPPKKSEEREDVQIKKLIAAPM